MTAPAIFRTVSQSPEQTLDIAERLGRQLGGGDVVALEGELGAGKTLFTKGLARGAGVAAWREVRSPSFVLINVYHGRMAIYHIDAYRLGGDADFEELGCEEFLHDPGTLVVVEWANRVAEAIDEPFLAVRLDHAGPTARSIDIAWAGPPPRPIHMENA